MITVLMGVYNERLDWLQKAVTSILQQTYRNLEFLIVVDNPKLPEELKTYLENASQEDERIRLVYNPQNIGLAATLNRGIDLARGQYIARMDADDISKTTRLEKQLYYLTKHDYDLVATNKENIDEEGRLLFVDPPIEKKIETLIFDNFIIHSSVLVKTDVIRKLHGYQLMPNSEDYDLWLRMQENHYRIGILDENLLSYRLRANSASIGRQLEQYYVKKYILKLAKKRRKQQNDTPYDSDDLRALLDRKLTDKRKKRFALAQKHIDVAVSALREKNLKKCAGGLLCAGFYYPILPIEVALTYIRTKVV